MKALLGSLIAILALTGGAQAAPAMWEVSDGDSAIGYSRQPELYPRTRTSDAASLRLRYYLPYRAAMHWEYRTYGDTWHIDATTVEMRRVLGRLLD